ncbi:MAG TPA: hypothetical protein VNG13_03220 [Mycobacteriales bacterium]|nr:hypothetical protein [Mycobacteriales bacterium]
MRTRRLIATLGGLAAVLAAGPAQAAGAPVARFTVPVQLLGASGGEPSIATDRLGNVYVDGPQGIPAGVNDEPGVGFWASHNDGTSFGPAQHIGSFAGGGDSDVIVDPKGTVFTDDLEAAATDVCKSTDKGKTFTSIGPVPDPTNCSSLPYGQVGPSDDRPWLNSGPHGRLYLTYHEFVSAQPLIFRSDNGGADLFGAGPCGSIITDPTIEANVPTDITGGTLVSKPVTDAAGNLYVMFTTTTQAENAAAAAAGKPSGTFSQIYLAVSTDHCQTFTDHTVFDGATLFGTNDVQFGDIFNALTVDGAGNLYAVAAGYVGHKTFDSVAKLYLFSSTDHGTRWTGPIELGPAGAAKMMPSAIGGPRSGQLAIGYFRTVNGVTDPNLTSGHWTYATAETTNATSPNPTFGYTDVRPGYLYHVGDICNLGILCGAVPGGPSDRSLLDFTSATLDGQGCPLFTFAGNPPALGGEAKGTWNFVTRQTSGCFPAAVAVTVHPPVTATHPTAATAPAANGALPETGLDPRLPIIALGALALALTLLRLGRSKLARSRRGPPAG